VSNELKFYCWSRWSTCTKARRALNQTSHEYEFRDFFKEQLSADEIRNLSKLTSIDEMFAWKSPSSKDYRELRGKASDDELIELMIREPRLIRRPILTDGLKIVFGYKQGAYDELI